MPKLFLLLIFSFFVSFVPAQKFSEILERNNCVLKVRVNQYDTARYNFLSASSTVHLDKNNLQLRFKESTWQINHEIIPLIKSGNYKVAVTFRCVSGMVNNASLSIDLTFSNWSKEAYVLMPAAVYNGNRYETIRMDYMPFFSESQFGKNKPLYMADIPRLNTRNGLSRIQEPSGAMSLPAVGFHNDAPKKGFWLLGKQGNDYGDYGYDIEENNTRTKATISITSPVVREVHRYSNTRMDAQPSTDKTANFKVGDSITIEFVVAFFESKKVQDLFDKLMDLKSTHYPAVLKQPVIPLSESFKIVEKQRNKDTWREAGYYAGNVKHGQETWKPAWIAGFTNTYALQMDGSPTSLERVASNLEWAFDQGLTPAGFYWYKIDKNGKFGLKPEFRLSKDLSFTRLQAEAVYFVFKQLDLLKRKGMNPNPKWLETNMTVVNAVINLWKRNGQLGQFFDHNTGELIVGNTTSGGIFPAALCLAFQQTKDKQYLQYAIEIADYYYQHFTSKGIMCGGPADALQGFDSESAYGLLESYTELFETTGDTKWLTRGIEMGNQFASWVMAYNYDFPAQSTLGKLQIKTAGLVFANTQNNTACPSICSASGIALLKLYRATRNPAYLEMLSDIAYAITQYMSWKDHPIPGFEEGWIYERGGTSDWDNPVGEITAHNSFPGIPLMLTFAELPGVYVDLDNKRAFAIDQVKATFTKEGKLEITNPTKYDALVKVLAETQKQMQQPLETNAALNWEKVSIPAGTSISLKF